MIEVYAYVLLVLCSVALSPAVTWQVGRWLRARAERRIAAEQPIFKSGGPIEGGSVMFDASQDDVSLPPAIEDSPALSANAVDDKGEPAFTLAGTEKAIRQAARFGEVMRRCDSCQSKYTDSHVVNYEAVPAREDPRKMQVLCVISERCANCGASGQYRTVPSAVAAIEAAKVMASAEMALEGLKLRIARGEDLFGG